MLAMRRRRSVRIVAIITVAVVVAAFGFVSLHPGPPGTGAELVMPFPAQISFADSAVVTWDVPGHKPYRFAADAQRFTPLTAADRPKQYPAGARQVNPLADGDPLDYDVRPHGFEQSADGIHWTPIPFPVLPYPS